MYQVLLYYKYVQIDDPEKLKEQQKQLMERLGLKCRVIIAKEGINGTLEGEKEKTEEYIREMIRDQRFADIHWKLSDGNGESFPKINIKIRDEIVALNLGEEDIDPNETTGKYITADELHELYEKGEEFYVVDMRNDYEQKVGHFEDAILMPMSVFRQLPEKIEEISHLKDKLVVTTCTGGIRCEKASGFLLKNGFTNVYQLKGGMHTYIEKYPNQHFLGKLYVFDGRVVWGVNEEDPEHKVISSCELCARESDSYVDCSYLHCKDKRHFIACENCADEQGNIFCTQACRQEYYANKKTSSDLGILSGIISSSVSEVND
ncbi:MAG: rhodanese-related sulfurtransferase [Candidatus Dojkabacteria bacterium]